MGNHKGQATIEYLLILAFLVTIAGSIKIGFTSLFSNNLTRLNKILTIHLGSGVCPEHCFTTEPYENDITGY